MKKIIKAILIIFVFLYALFLIGKGDKMFNKENNNNNNNNVISYSNIPNYKEENKKRYIKYGENNEELSMEEVIKRVNINLDVNFYEDIEDAINKNTNLVLVNKHYYLDKDYIPNNLELVDYKYTSGIKVYA